MRELGYPRDTKYSTSRNPTYRALQATGEILSNLMEFNKNEELTIYMKGNKHRLGIYLRLPKQDNFDYAAEGRKIGALIASGTDQDSFSRIQEKQAKDEDKGRHGHAGLGCFYAQIFADGIKTRQWLNNGKEGTEVFILIRRNRKY